MLLSAENDLITKKKSCKQNLVWLYGSCNGKVIFTLLAKVIVLYMGDTVVDVRGLGLKFVSRKSTF